MISLTLLRLFDTPETPPQEVCLLKFIAYHLLLGLLGCYMQLIQNVTDAQDVTDAQRPEWKADVEDSLRDRNFGQKFWEAERISQKHSLASTKNFSLLCWNYASTNNTWVFTYWAQCRVALSILSNVALSILSRVALSILSSVALSILSSAVWPSQSFLIQIPYGIGHAFACWSFEVKVSNAAGVLYAVLSSLSATGSA